METDTLHFFATEETGDVSCSEAAIKAVRAYMFWWNGFNEDFHKSISMNNFFYNYIFNI